MNTLSGTFHIAQHTHLRPVTAADAPFLYALYASTRAEEMALLAWPPEQQAAFLRMQFQAQHAHYQHHFALASFDVIEHAGHAIGRLYVDRRADEIRVIDIVLLPAYRRRGIGSQHMRQLLDEAAAARLPLRLHVEQFNPALRWYQRLGFEQIEDQGVYLLMERQPPQEQHRC